MRQVLLHPGEDGYWVVECPSLPGCVTQGKSKEEALENIKEAIRGYVASLRQDGLPVPDERFDALLVNVATQVIADAERAANVGATPCGRPCK